MRLPLLCSIHDHKAYGLSNVKLAKRRLIKCKNNNKKWNSNTKIKTAHILHLHCDNLIIKIIYKLNQGANLRPYIA